MHAASEPPRCPEHPTGRRRHLVLIPTRTEFELATPLMDDLDVDIELCGFGPVAAAARCAHRICRNRPASVLLLGIAGGLADSAAPGTAIRFATVACYGIGAGQGAAFEPAERLGWLQWPGGGDSRPVGDLIPLAYRPEHPRFDPPQAADGPLLVTACSASASEQEARWKRQAFPLATAEDMEGYGVALACHLAGVPVSIIRGISNRAGDRDKAHWDFSAAITAAVALARQLEFPMKA